MTTFICTGTAIAASSPTATAATTTTTMTGHGTVMCCVGPSVLEVFNNLLRHLRISVDSKDGNHAQSAAELKFQDAIVNTIGQCHSTHIAVVIVIIVISRYRQHHRSVSQYPYCCNHSNHSNITLSSTPSVSVTVPTLL